MSSAFKGTIQISSETFVNSIFKLIIIVLRMHQTFMFFTQSLYIPLLQNRKISPFDSYYLWKKEIIVFVCRAQRS